MSDRSRRWFALVAILVTPLGWVGQAPGQDCNGNGIADAKELRDLGDFTDSGVAYWRFESAAGGGVPDFGGSMRTAEFAGPGTFTGSAASSWVVQARLRNESSLRLQGSLDGACDPNEASGCGSGSCCEPRSTPGCGDAVCCAIVCDSDPFCCDSVWDSECANIAIGSCAGAGHLEVADGDGVFSFGNASFTIEGWVRLEALGSSGDPQSKMWLVQKKPIPSADSQLDYGFLVQAGELGQSGRELAGRFGNGNATINVVSSLVIQDFEWHYVAMIHDAAAGKLRFQLDEEVQSFDFNKPNQVNDGPVWIGAHVAGNGAINQRLVGSVDEIRISAAARPRGERLVSFPTGGDCNGNGVPDDCDFASGGGDCDGNGVLDTCQIASGEVEDCQGDGIPDSCQTLPPILLSHNDGESDASAMSDGTHTAWLERFEVRNGYDTVTAIRTPFGSSSLGYFVSIHIWSDPNQDGDPTDAQPLITVPYQIVQDDLVVQIDLPRTYVGPEGTKYFVGFVSSGPILFPAACDFDPPYEPGTSWIVGADVQIDPADLSANAVEFEPLDAAGFSDGVNWMIDIEVETSPGDCNGNGVPDDCDIVNGTSADCQGDGIPDDCQLGTSDVVLRTGAGNPAINWGLEQAGGIAWFTQFRTEYPDTTIDSIHIRRGEQPPGTPMTVCIWGDPNNDGDPTDAVLLSALEATACNGTGCAFQLDPVTFADPGTSFFLGAVLWDPTGTIDPCPLDGENPVARGWIVARFDAPIDPANLADGADYIGLTDDYDIAPGFPAISNHFIDGFGTTANPSNDQDGNGIPDECVIECPGDLDGDGIVGGSDLGQLFAQWGGSGSADFDGNGLVSGADLGILFTFWGDCP
jgi:hypothetical protein